MWRGERVRTVFFPCSLAVCWHSWAVRNAKSERLRIWRRRRCPVLRPSRRVRAKMHFVVPCWERVVPICTIVCIRMANAIRRAVVSKNACTRLEVGLKKKNKSSALSIVRDSARRRGTAKDLFFPARERSFSGSFSTAPWNFLLRSRVARPCDTDISLLCTATRTEAALGRGSNGN